MCTYTYPDDNHAQLLTQRASIVMRQLAARLQHLAVCATATFIMGGVVALLLGLALDLVLIVPLRVPLHQVPPPPTDSSSSFLSLPLNPPHHPPSLPDAHLPHTFRICVESAEMPGVDIYVCRDKYQIICA